MTSEAVRTRLQTAADPNKALEQLGALLKQGDVLRAVIIAECPGNEMHLIGQNARPESMAQMLMIAAEALAQVPEQPEQRAEAKAAPTSAPKAGPGIALDSIAGQWAKLEAGIFNADTNPIQRREMRRTFYAGAATIFELMTRLFEPGDDATPTDLNRLDGWKDELDRFGADI